MESRSSLAGQMARLTGFENQLMYQGGHTMGPILGVNQRIPIYVYCIRVILSDLLNSTFLKKNILWVGNAKFRIYFVNSITFRSLASWLKEVCSVCSSSFGSTYPP